MSNNYKFPIRENSHTTIARQWVVFFVLVGLFFGACGNKKTQLQSQIQVEPLVQSDPVGTPFQSNLVDTEWVIVAMAGFPEDNFTDATFTLKNDWFGYYDGVNWGGSEIMWKDSGFTVIAAGTMTNMGPHEGDSRYLHTLVETRAHVEIIIRTDGSLTLTRGELMVTAESAR